VERKKSTARTWRSVVSLMDKRSRTRPFPVEPDAGSRKMIEIHDRENAWRKLLPVSILEKL